MNTEVIGIIGAMSSEVSGLVDLFRKDFRKEELSGVTYIAGKIGDKNVVIAASGIGKVFSSFCAQTMIMKYNPSIIINVGVGGALFNTMNPGDIVISDKVVQYDMNTSALGDPVGYISGIRRVFIECDKDLVKTFSSLGKKYKGGVGTIATGDSFTDNFSCVEDLKGRYGAVLCDMESASIAQVCYVNNVRFISIRTVANYVGVNSGSDYEKNLMKACSQLVKIMRDYLIGSKKDKIESFVVDHNKLEPGLYVSRLDKSGDCYVTTFDMRYRIPNKEPVMDIPAMHTIEHLGATYLRIVENLPNIVYFGPMGCRTGFYMILFGKLKSEDVYDLVIRMCDYIIDYDGDIPGATSAECGNYLEQNLQMAKYYTRIYKKRLVADKNFQYVK